MSGSVVAPCQGAKMPPWRMMSAGAGRYQGLDEDVLDSPLVTACLLGQVPPLVLADAQLERAIFPTRLRQLVQVIGHRRAYCDFGGDAGSPESEERVRNGHMAAYMVAGAPSAHQCHLVELKGKVGVVCLFLIPGGQLCAMPPVLGEALRLCIRRGEDSRDIDGCPSNASIKYRALVLLLVEIIDIASTMRR